MKTYLSPRFCFRLCQIAGIGLLFALWIGSDEIAGFFLLLSLVIMALLRWRFPRLNRTVLFDLMACISMFALWDYAPYALAVPLFAAMYFGAYWAVLAGLYLFFYFDPFLAAVLILSALGGVFLGLWERERQEKIKTRDMSAGRYYELEELQADLTAALAQVERMTAVAERTRIARDIHDNAGHEIVAAYISLQTARAMMDGASADALELYDAALERLDSGANKIREAVHNLSAVTTLGVETLEEICNRFPGHAVTFRVYGDTSGIPMYVWNMLESCLSESLTNVSRHAAAKRVTVDLDATPYLVRLCIENDGVTAPSRAAGSGLRNLRQRAAAIGGNLSVDAGGVSFRLVCVIPLKEERDEVTHSR
ncbi:MAG: histidine kinase [Oscillospiraceae bacterium]|nr:histidine kinase [Oscillospiraceae bacterium]